MWKCKKCNEQVEGNFDFCWNCYFDKQGNYVSKKEESEILATDQEISKIEAGMFNPITTSIEMVDEGARRHDELYDYLKEEILKEEILK